MSGLVKSIFLFFLLLSSLPTSGDQFGTVMVVQKQKSCPGRMAGCPGWQGGLKAEQPSVFSSQKEFRLEGDQAQGREVLCLHAPHNQ